MQMRLPLAAVVVALLAGTGCDQLTGLNEGEDLLGLTCSEGNDTTLIGLWEAESYDWGEGDVIAAGWELEIELWEDGDGRLAETKPVESDSAETGVAPDPAAAGSGTVTDSAHFEWAACDGQLAVVFGETFYSSEGGEFTDSRFDYSYDGTTLSLSDGETGTTMTLRLHDTAAATRLDEALFGTWTAVSITASDEAGQYDPVELTGEGWALDVTLNDDGTYSMTSQEGSESEPVTESGEYAAEDGILTLDNGPNLYYEVSGDQVTVTDSEGEASYDFDGDGTDEPAVFVYVFERSG